MNSRCTALYSFQAPLRLSNGPRPICRSPPVSKEQRRLDHAGRLHQDSWAIMDKVTLNVGARYDQQMISGTNKGALTVPEPRSVPLGRFDLRLHPKRKVEDLRRTSLAITSKFRWTWPCAPCPLNRVALASALAQPQCDFVKPGISSEEALAADNANCN